MPDRISTPLDVQAARGPRIVPYDVARHGDGPWQVVRGVFAEYGFPFAEHGYDADLVNVELHYNGTDGWLAVAETAAPEVVGCAGVTDEGNGEFELHRLYVRREWRRRGLGEDLTRWVIAVARAQGARRLVLYSDVHFEDAHRLYRRLGFRCHRFRYAPDPWESREWGFELELSAAAPP